MTIHTIEPSPETLHGYFSKDLPPVLTIESGDMVHFKTLDAGWGLEPPPPPRKKMQPVEPLPFKGHALCGPIFIKGAKPDMVLEVQINEVLTGTYGYTTMGGFLHPVMEALGLDNLDEQFMVWELDAAANTARNQFGHEVSMQPFAGVLGMPPPESGQHRTAPPRIWGGNIDCKELVAGTTLYLPIPVEGALFSAGDGHAAQGDGEVAVTAIECPLERLSLTLTVRDDISLKTPRAKVQGGWITFGMHEDMWQATTMALDAMLDLMGEQYDVSRRQAIALSSAVVDLRITQIANGVLGVHAFLPDDAIR